jgi:hypothetical protein
MWVSGITIIVGLVPLLLISPLCDCPRYYIIVAAIGLVPLACGPRLYRWFGCSYIVVALLFAYLNYSHAIYMREQIERIGTEAAQQHP